MTWRWLLGVMAAAGVASADPGDDRGYVQGGVMIGAFSGGGLAALTVDAGVRIPDSPVIAHAAVAVGDNLGFDDTEDGTFWLAVGGLELRRCTTAEVCAVLGVDAGYQRLQLDARTGPGMTTSGPLVGPRIGVDGGGRLRFRFTIALDRWFEDSPIEPSVTLVEFGLGAAYWF